jgi:S1-C subfamily serine protease
VQHSTIALDFDINGQRMQKISKRFFSAFLLGLVPFTIGFSSFDGNEDLFKEKIASYLNRANSSPEILDLTPQLLARPTMGAEVFQTLVTEDLFPRLVEGIVYIVSGDGVTGSGTIISSSFGLIVTNWHVVGSEPVVGLVFKPNRTRGRISFRKDDVYFARVLKTDAPRDLALLEIISPPDRIISVPLGSMERISVGHDVFSVSHPRGSLWSYHEGVISEMEPNYEWISETGTLHRAATIHTAAPDDSGSSGDPLFDAHGKFIGLLAGSSSAGNNFAISVDEIRSFVFSSLR